MIYRRIVTETDAAAMAPVLSFTVRPKVSGATERASGAMKLASLLSAPLKATEGPDSCVQA